jgi:hypothetical protein
MTGSLLSLALAFSLAAQETTTVAIPVDGGDEAKLQEELGKIRLEFLQCTKCGTTDDSSLVRCAQCGQHLIVVHPEGNVSPSVEYRAPNVRLQFGARGDALGILYLSSVDDALKQTGATRPTEGVMIRGPFQLHMSDEMAAFKAAGALREMERIVEVENTGRILHVKADGAEWEKILQAVGRDQLRDVSWILTRGSGEIGFSRP